MGRSHEVLAFCLCLSLCVAAFFHESLFGGKVLSPADVLLVSASFRDEEAADYEPANRLLMDPVLQFQPWLDFNRRMIRQGQLPLWNSFAGCGAPHLANGQSAVFDPFHLIAYLGSTPQAYAFMAAGRLWMAGLGMFLLARSWGLGLWGRWFAGLTYPFCGFLVVWLLFPVTPVAIWMPWLFLTTDRVLQSPGARASAWLAVAVALTIFGGHIQTSAHVLLAGGLYAAVSIGWRACQGARWRHAMLAWSAGTTLGLGLAAVQILPLGFYLTKSSVWSDRRGERSAWWQLERPRLLDAACTAVPYMYGSQRRGHPNLARALGVHNLNESAAGYSGLATLMWLAPLAVATHRRSRHGAFLIGLVLIGMLGAFRLPPIDNLLRALPVLEVTDNRRLTLWIAFGLSLLGGMGLDNLSQTRRLPRSWLYAWIAVALFLTLAAAVVPRFEDVLRHRAAAHYRHAALVAAGADPAAYQERADRQVRQALEFLPQYYGLVGIELGMLALLALHVRRTQASPAWIAPALIAMTLFDLALFGFDLNPAISPEIQAFEPPVIRRLRQQLPADGRALGIGEELPPNTLMRFGLRDVRNYDSVEMASNLAWLSPLYERTQAPLSSRGEINWRGVVAARDRLLDSGVSAVVGASPPPEGAFERVERVGRVFIAWQSGKPWAQSETTRTRIEASHGDGSAHIFVDAPEPDRITVRESYDPGWHGWLDGKPVKIEVKSAFFFNINIPRGHHELILKYDPIEVRGGLLISVMALACLILVLTGNRLFWIPGITTVKGLDGSEPSG